MVLVDLDDVALRRDQLHPDDGGRDAMQAAPGAVGAGRDGAGHRLRVDVTEVGEGEPEREQLRVELVQRHARLDAHASGRRVVGEHVVHSVETEQHAVGRGDRGERVAGTVGLDRKAL